MIVRRILKGYLSKRVQYFLWIFIPVYMILCLFIEFPVAIPDFGNTYTYITDAIPEKTISNEVKESSEIISVKKFPQKNQNIHDRWNKIHTEIEMCFMYFHKIGILFIIMLFFYNMYFYVKCRKERILVDVRGKINVYQLPDIQSPFLFLNGIYLPVYTKKNEVCYKYCVIHEEKHWKQGDAIWSVIRYIIVLYNWYNPLAWIAGKMVELDKELSCDECVLSEIGHDERIGYGEMLLEFMAKNVQKNFGTITTSMNGGGKYFMRERICNIANYSKKTFGAALIAVTVSALSVGIVLAKPILPVKTAANVVTVQTKDDMSIADNKMNSGNVSKNTNIMEKKNWIVRNYYGENGELKMTETNILNENGDIIQTAGSFPSGKPNGSYSKYILDDKGRKIKGINYKEDGSLMNSERIYTYNESGSFLSVSLYSNKELESTVSYLYDENGNKIVKETADGNGNIKQNLNFQNTYDDNGLLTKYSVFEVNGTDKCLQEIVICSYDSNGNLSKESEYDTTGKLTGFWEYQY